MKTVAAVVAAAATISLSACGGGSSDGGGGGGDAPKLDTAQQAVADHFAKTAAESPQSLVTDPTKAQCWADGVVAGIGVDRLKELGITASEGGPANLAAVTDSEATTVTDSLYSCVDVKALMVSQMEEQQGVSAEDAKCVVDKIDDSAIKQIMNASILGQTPDGDALQNFVQAGIDCAGG